MLNDAEGEISIVATSASSSLLETFSQLNSYTAFTFELSDVAVIAIYCSTFMGFNFSAFFGWSISTLYLLVSNSLKIYFQGSQRS